MTEQSTTMERPSLQNIDADTAKSLLREAAIGRQQQSGSFMPEQAAKFRSGENDRSIGFDDAVYALTHADKVWSALGKQT